MHACCASKDVAQAATAATVLLTHGADVDAANALGDTALSACEVCGLTGLCLVQVVFD